MAIYTKKGDKGKTSLYDPDVKEAKRVSKSSVRIEAIGSVDEVNSSLGVAVSLIEDKDTIDIIKQIQRELLTIGSILAGSDLDLREKQIDKLENTIDELEGKLPVLGNFILPGGSGSAAHLHQSRSVTRRAERAIVSLAKVEKVDGSILKYINRLSDLLFMLARDENKKHGIKEEVWKSEQSS